MADKKKKKRRSSKGSRLFGGRTFGVDMGDTAWAGLAGTIGKVVAPVLNKEGVPDFIKKAELSDVGLFAIGLMLKKPHFRSIGLGLALSRSYLAVAP